MRPSFVHHLHPPSIPARQARLRHTLAAGGLVVFLGLVLLATGLLETFYYIPTPEQAAASIQELTFLVPYGGLVRNLHYWAAQLLVAVTVLHLLRVIFTGAYNPPRRFNYILGMILVPLAVLLDFSGYVLRWDEGIHWALVTGTNLVAAIPLIGKPLYAIIVGGSQPGAATLVRFYGWHLYGLAGLAGVLTVWHLFRVRRDGGIATPPPLQRETRQRISRVELVRREVLAMLLAGVVLLLLATFAPAPLAAPIGTTTNAKDHILAPWFLVWVQELLKLGSPFLFGVIVPLAVLFLLTFIPYLPWKPAESEAGTWFPRSNRPAQVLAGIITLLLVLLTLLAILPAP